MDGMIVPFFSQIKEASACANNDPDLTPDHAGWTFRKNQQLQIIIPGMNVHLTGTRFREICLMGRNGINDTFHVRKKRRIKKH
jgi:hypothetical protein